MASEQYIWFGVKLGKVHPNTVSSNIPDKQDTSETVSHNYKDLEGQKPKMRLSCQSIWY